MAQAQLDLARASSGTSVIKDGNPTAFEACSISVLLQKSMIPTECEGLTRPFLELEEKWEMWQDEEGSNVTSVDFSPTTLRMNPDYSLYYVHLTHLFIKGILPFGALVFLNLGIYRYTDMEVHTEYLVA